MFHVNPLVRVMIDLQRRHVYGCQTDSVCSVFIFKCWMSRFHSWKLWRDVCLLLIDLLILKRSSVVMRWHSCQASSTSWTDRCSQTPPMLPEPQDSVSSQLKKCRMTSDLHVNAIKAADFVVRVSIMEVVYSTGRETDEMSSAQRALVQTAVMQSIF